MSKAPSTARRWAWNLLRLTITVSCVAYVVSEITWMDRLRLADDQWVKGWYRRDANGAPVLVAEDGQTHAIPPEPDDPKVASPFVPGFITLFRQVDLGLLGVALAAYPVTIFLLARRWQWLLQTHHLDPGFREALRLTWIGLLANNVLPSSTGGDLVKGWCIYRRTPQKRTAAVMTVLLDRVLGLVSLMLVGATAILTQRSSAELESPARFVGWGLLAVLVGGIVYFSGRIRRLLRISEVIERLPFEKQIRTLDDSLFHYRGHIATLVRCVGISLIIHVWTIFCIYLLGKALGLRVAIHYYYVFLPMIFTCGAFFPSIAGLGVLEGLFQQLFSMPGVGATPASAVALCILYRGMQLLASLPGAFPTYREFSAHGVPTIGGEATAGEIGELQPTETPAIAADRSLTNLEPAC